MNKLLHYATCAVWQTSVVEDCDCSRDRTWRIRKEPDEVFPWRIWRRTSDNVYEPLMRCSTFEGARQLVVQFEWLRINAIRSR